MSSITTRTGDNGTTGLVFGQRVSKAHPRIEAVGRLDEFNAALGFAKASLPSGATAGRDTARFEILEAIQRDLIAVMGELAAADADADRYQESRFDKLSLESLARLDTAIADLEARQLPFDGWATPGRTVPAAALDLARVAARRAERHLVSMQEAGAPIRPLLIQYLNRTSDLLWLLAREAEEQTSARDL
jgi:cob(I)alamin adenosyltransferase